jgi:hypothetical protein
MMKVAATYTHRPVSSKTLKRACKGKPRTIATVTANAQAAGNVPITHSSLPEVATTSTNVADVAAASPASAAM